VEFGGDSVMLVGTANIQSTGDCGVGLTRGWGGAWSTSYPSGLTDNRVRSISLGPSGECWASTERAGLDVYSQGAWTAFHDIFPSEYQMFSVAGLPGGGVFVSHYHSGVTYLDWNGTPETSDDYHFTLDKGNSGLLNDQVVSMSVGADGTVWFGQEPYWESESEPSGVTRLRWTEGEISSATWVSWSGASGLPSGRVAAVADAGGGTAWVGTAEGLVEVGPGPGDVSEVIGVGQGLPSADVRSVALGRDGRLFAGTTAGLSRVDPENMSASSVEGVEGTISSLCFDHLGAVWAAGTATNALYRIDPDGSVEVYNTYNSPLLSTLVYGIAEDANEGLLYVACDHGIWQLDLGSGLSEGSGAVLFPNPFVPGRGDVLGVAGLPDLPTTLRVFDLNGRLVYESSFPDRDGIAWDGGGSDGSPVSSGIYVVEVGQSGATELLKLAVVR
jgi:ligand-binding sensor domain-containing protein